jgi:hypothetical protein
MQNRLRLRFLQCSRREMRRLAAEDVLPLKRRMKADTQSSGNNRSTFLFRLHSHPRRAMAKILVSDLCD